MTEYKVKYFKNRAEWYNLEGQRHREDGPAVEYIDGYKAWWVNGKRHREDGPAIEHENGDKEWYKDGKLHREDGPAKESAFGVKEWFMNGCRYGPIIEWPSNSNDDDEITEEEFLAITQSVVTLDQIAEKFNIPVDKLKIKK